MKRRLGVLVSGSGTNLQALLDAAAAPDYPAEVGLVVSNVESAFALERARKANIASRFIDHQAFRSRDDFEKEVVSALRAHRVEIVCLAGFMRLLGQELLNAYRHHILNVHPALLPAFPGLHGARQALAHGAKIAGCTVHLVDEGTDRGPIVAQAAVAVLPDDDEKSLQARIQAQEHLLYPLAVRWLAEGRLRVEGRRVLLGGEPVADALALRNPGRAEG